MRTRTILALCTALVLFALPAAGQSLAELARTDVDQLDPAVWTRVEPGVHARTGENGRMQVIASGGEARDFIRSHCVGRIAVRVDQYVETRDPALWQAVEGTVASLRKLDARGPQSKAPDAPSVATRGIEQLYAFVWNVRLWLAEAYASWDDSVSADVLTLAITSTSSGLDVQTCSDSGTDVDCSSFSVTSIFECRAESYAEIYVPSTNTLTFESDGFNNC